METMIEILIAIGVMFKWTLIVIAVFIIAIIALFCGARAITSGILAAQRYYNKKKKEISDE